jgi:sulfite exporter TauE/SafE
MAGATGAPLRGAVVMGAFWIGTVPALAVASAALRRLAASSPFARRAVAAVVFAAGLSAIVLRAQPAEDTAAPPCHAAAPH